MSHLIHLVLLISIALNYLAICLLCKRVDNHSKHLANISDLLLHIVNLRTGDKNSPAAVIPFPKRDPN